MYGGNGRHRIPKSIIIAHLLVVGFGHVTQSRLKIKNGIFPVFYFFPKCVFNTLYASVILVNCFVAASLSPVAVSGW